MVAGLSRDALANNWATQTLLLHATPSELAIFVDSHVTGNSGNRKKNGHLAFGLFWAYLGSWFLLEMLANIGGLVLVSTNLHLNQLRFLSQL